MKILTALLVLVSTNVFAYAPKYEIIHDEDNTVTLATENDTDRVLDCGYSISWFENTLTYKRYFGTFKVAPGEFSIIGYKNEAVSRLTRIKARVECND